MKNGSVVTMRRHVLALKYLYAADKAEGEDVGDFSQGLMVGSALDSAARPSDISEAASVPVTPCV